MYAMIMTQSDLIYSFLVSSRYCFNLYLTHVNAIIRVFKYIKKMFDYDIYYKSKEDLIKYINIDFAETVNYRRFLNNYVFFLSKNLIS